MGFKISKNDGSLHTEKAIGLKAGIKKFFAGDYNMDKFTYIGENGKWTPPELVVKIFRGAKAIKNIEKITSSAETLDDYFSDLSPTISEAGKAVKAFTDIIGFSKFGSVYGKYGTAPGELIGDLLAGIIERNYSVGSTAPAGAVAGGGGSAMGGRSGI